MCVCLKFLCMWVYSAGVGALGVTKSNLPRSNQPQCLPSHISGRALRSTRAHRPTHAHTPKTLVTSTKQRTHCTHTYTHSHLQGTLCDLSPLVQSQSPQHLHHVCRDNLEIRRRGKCKGLGRQRCTTNPFKNGVF